MSTYSNRLQPAFQNLLQLVVRFFHPRSSCTTTHISVDVQRIKLNASCMRILGERTEQLDIFCRITGFTSDFRSFIDVELIRFFHGALQLCILYLCGVCSTCSFSSGQCWQPGGVIRYDNNHRSVCVLCCIEYSGRVHTTNTQLSALWLTVWYAANMSLV